MRFELLYGRYAPAVKAYVLRRAGTTMADDVVSEVFTVCWRRFDEVPANPLPWLLGVARRVLSTHRRGERRRLALRDRLVETHDRSGDAATTIDDGSLARALARLSDPDRELLLLIAWDGLSPAEAATVLGIKAPTARVRLLRARRRLIHALANEQSTCISCAPVSMEASS